MPEHVCPWWLGYLLASPIRKLIQDPQKILSPYVKSGMAALDIGPGMGYFTIPMARLAGPKGKVYAVDLQEKMIGSLKRRAARSSLNGIIETRICTADSLRITDLAGRIDFALTFAVLHETPDIGRVIREVHATLKPGGCLLIAEPSGHVTADDFADTTSKAVNCGFEIVARPTIRRSLTLLLRRT